MSLGSLGVNEVAFQQTEEEMDSMHEKFGIRLACESMDLES